MRYGLHFPVGRIDHYGHAWVTQETLVGVIEGDTGVLGHHP